MTARVFVIVSLLLALLVPSARQTDAISATCLPGGFPATPTPPVYSTETSGYRIEVWRVPCQDTRQVALLLRSTPKGPEAEELCGHRIDSDLFFLQGGSTPIVAILHQSPYDTDACVNRFAPMTLALEPQAGRAAFFPERAFTLIVEPALGSGRTELNIADWSAVAPLRLTLVATGCVPCSRGQDAAFHLHVTNSGLPLVAELKAAIYLPSNEVFTLLGPYAEQPIGTGEFDIPLGAVTIPVDAILGPYTLEAALLDRNNGATLSRSRLRVDVR